MNSLLKQFLVFYLLFVYFELGLFPRFYFYLSVCIFYFYFFILFIHTQVYLQKQATRSPEPTALHQIG